MDLFNQAETQNRPIAERVLDHLLKDGYSYKRNGFKDRTDFTILKDNTVVAYLEVKHRNCSLGAYPDYQLDGNKATYLLGLDKPTYYLNTFSDGGYSLWLITPNIGEWRMSKPHYKHTVLCDYTIRTKDLFLTLKEAAKYGYIEKV